MSRVILTSRSTPTSQLDRRRGFTAIEMLIVIAILVVLVTIVVIALRAMVEPAKANATRATMQVLTNISVESLATKPRQDRFYGVEQWQITREAPNDDEKFFCSAPIQDYDLSATDPTPQAFIQTQKILYVLTQTPKARALFDSISADLKVKPDGMGDASNNTENQMVGLKSLERSSGYVFRTAIEGEGDAPFNYPFPAYNNTELRDANKNLWVKLPLVIDSWGNPILFVPDGFMDVNRTDDRWPDAAGNNATSNPGNALPSTRGGLIRVKSESNKTWWNVNGDDTPAGYTRAVDPRQTPPEQDAVRAPDRRPFWVSAGPDGKYETHDDNIYSFIE